MQRIVLASFVLGLLSSGLLACGASAGAPDDSSPAAGGNTSFGGHPNGKGGNPGSGGNLNLGGASNGGGGSSGTTCNAGAYDFPGNGIDEDCNGTADDEPANCDSSSDVGDLDPMAAARALGLCRVAQGPSWGVVAANYVLADGSPGMNDISHGLLPNFGPALMPREGPNMLALSSGSARRPGDAGFQSPEGDDMGTSSAMPPGFPIPSPSCPGVMQAPGANDAAALEISLRVPTNARGIKFDFDFYTYEFPDYICSEFNDFFVAVMDPAPPGAQSGNVSFDSQGNPVSVNNGYLEVCNPQNAGGKNFDCALGSSELQATGYDEPMETGPHAATGWLTTEAPVTPGTDLTIRFAIWDAGDHVLDSLVLIDNISWIESEVTQPSTKPVK